MRLAAGLTSARGGPVVVLTGPPTAVQRQLIPRVGRVAVNSEGRLTDLDFLLPWAPRIRRLVVSDYGLSAISRMHALEELELHTGATRKTPPVDLTPLSSLRSFGALWSPAFESVFACSGLQKLMIFQPPSSLGRDIAGLAHLRRLDVRDSKATITLAGPPAGSALNELRLAGLRLADTAALTSWTALESLTLDDVRGIDDLSSLRHVSRLRFLAIEDCGRIPSLAFLRVPPLQRLHLIGTTDITDGDLLALQGLKTVTFPARPHYNATARDLASRP